jgi:cell wall-associated NlpC family hydrolase
MDWYKNYKLVEDKDGFSIIVTLNPDSNEFSNEFLENVKENVLELDDKIKNFVNDNFSNIKINSVKLMLGTVIVASIPFMANTQVKAADTITPLATSAISATTTDTSQATSSLNFNKFQTTGTVVASRLNMRLGPSVSYSVIHVLWQGNTVKVLGQYNEWYQIQLSDGRTGWANSQYMQIPERFQKINTVLTTAKSLLGTPYVWGGASLAQGGFDCSGFTQYVYKQAGITLNRVSFQQAQQGTYIQKESLQPGDLVFFSFQMNGTVNHVGIYIGDGKMIHSPKTGDVVKVADMTTSYWQVRLLTQKRML